jgi:hypothetical protein
VIRRFALGVWDFVVGDDWRIAVAVVLALGATAIVAAIGIAAWWVAPLGVLIVLAVAVRGAAPRPPSP